MLIVTPTRTGSLLGALDERERILRLYVLG